MARLVIGTSLTGVPAKIIQPTYCRTYEIGTNQSLQSDKSVTKIMDLTGVNYITQHTLSYAYYNCTGLTGHIDLSSIQILGNYALYYTFCYCTNITSVDLSSLKSATSNYDFSYCFGYCSNLSSVDLSSLASISYTGSMEGGFYHCTALTTLNLASLQMVTGSNSLRYFVGYTSMSDMRFPSLLSGCNAASFNSMLAGVTGCTVHFPSNLQASMADWSSVQNGFGGTNTVVLFDLPSSGALTGANSSTYYRCGKYDTTTALGWKSYNSATDIYYTSGITSPVVGNTIYSNSSCTIAVTTISAIGS